MTNGGNWETKSHLPWPTSPFLFSALQRIATASLVVVVQHFASCIKVVANVMSAGSTDLIRPKSTIKIVKLDGDTAVISWVRLLYALKNIALRGGESTFPTCFILGSHLSRTKVLEIKTDTVQKPELIKSFNFIKLKLKIKFKRNVKCYMSLFHPAT